MHIREALQKATSPSLELLRAAESEIYRLGSCREMLGGDKGDETLWDMCQRVIDGIGSVKGAA